MVSLGGAGCSQREESWGHTTMLKIVERKSKDGESTAKGNLAEVDEWNNGYNAASVNRAFIEIRRAIRDLQDIREYWPHPNTDAPDGHDPLRLFMRNDADAWITRCYEITSYYANPLNFTDLLPDGGADINTGGDRDL